MEEVANSTTTKKAPGLKPWKFIAAVTKIDNKLKTKIEAVGKAGNIVLIWICPKCKRVTKSGGVCSNDNGTLDPVLIDLKKRTVTAREGGRASRWCG